MSIIMYEKPGGILIHKKTRKNRTTSRTKDRLIKTQSKKIISSLLYFRKREKNQMKID
jgi:hypothetical protein